MLASGHIDIGRLHFMTLTTDNKKRFKSIGHGLKPVVMVAGNGLSEGVYAELERALLDHELIKVKLAIEDRDARREAIEQICRTTGAELVQSIGKVVLLYRESNKPKLHTSNVR